MKKKTKLREIPEFKDKESRLIFDCYEELFLNSTPSVSFKYLYQTSPTNKGGQVDIPFNDYEIEEDKLEEIISKYEKKLTGRLSKYRQRFRNTIYWGCSPSTKA